MTQKRPLSSMGSSGKLSAGASLQFPGSCAERSLLSPAIAAFTTLMRSLVDSVKFQELPESCVFVLSSEFTSSLQEGVFQFGGSSPIL